MTVTSNGGSAVVPPIGLGRQSPFMMMTSAVVPCGVVVRIRIESTVWLLGFSRSPSLFPLSPLSPLVVRAAVFAASHAVWNSRALRFASLGTRLGRISVSSSA